MADSYEDAYLDELDLYLHNEGELYPARQAIHHKLQRRAHVRGLDLKLAHQDPKLSKLAETLWLEWIGTGVILYRREIPNSPFRFSKALQRALAKRITGEMNLSEEL